MKEEPRMLIEISEEQQKTLLNIAQSAQVQLPPDLGMRGEYNFAELNRIGQLPDVVKVQQLIMALTNPVNPEAVHDAVEKSKVKVEPLK